MKFQSLQFETWPIGRIRPYGRNLRKNDHAVDRMVAAITEFGFKIPVLVRSDGELVDGHLRLKAARKLALAELPVILCDDWTPAQVQAFRLLVNRSASWAEWDMECVAFELQELKIAGFDVQLTGFNGFELDSALSLTSDARKADSVPSLP